MSQFGRPISTASAGAWSAVGAATLHEATDETSPNDATDYASATTNTAAFKVKLTSLTDPLASTGHIFRWEAWIDWTSPPTIQHSLSVDLMQGGGVVSTATFILTKATWTGGSRTLTGTEADSITDYTDLYLRFTLIFFGGSPSGVEGRVTWGELEVPDGPAAPPDQPVTLESAVVRVGALGAGAGPQAITVSGAGNFQWEYHEYDDEDGHHQNTDQIYLALNTGLLTVPWRPQAQVRYWEILTYAYADYTIDNEYDATGDLFRWAVTLNLHLYRQGPPLGLVSELWQQTFRSVWMPIGIAHDIHSDRKRGEGQYAFSEQATLTSHEPPSGPYMTRQVYAFHLNASFSATFQIRRTSTGAIVDELHLSAAGGLIYSDPPGTELTFAAGHRLNLDELGFYRALWANVHWSDVSLDSQYASAIGVTDGHTDFSGSVNAAQLRWTGNDTSDVHYWHHNQGGRQVPPSAHLEVKPSWALALDCDFRRYDTGAAVTGVAVEHWWGNTLVGTASAGTPYRYPASGYQHWVEATAADGVTYGDPSLPGVKTSVPAGTLSGVVAVHSSLLSVDDDADGGEGHTYLTTFKLQKAWADGYPTYLNSRHWGGILYHQSDRLLPRLGGTFEQGRLLWAQSHRFRHFEWDRAYPITTPFWYNFVPLSPPGEYDTAPVISENSSGGGADGEFLRVQVNPGKKALVSDHGGRRFRPFGYRYYRLRAKLSAGYFSTTLSANTLAGATSIQVADASGLTVGCMVQVGSGVGEESTTVSAIAGTTLTVDPLSQPHTAGDPVYRVGQRFRLCVDSVLGLLYPSGLFFPKYAWEFTFDRVNEWQTFPFDFMHPTLQGFIDQFTRVSGWNPTGHLLHAQEIWQGGEGGVGDGVGTFLALELVDGGVTYDFDWIEGYLRPEPGEVAPETNRTPVLMLFPLMGRGDTLDLHLVEERPTDGEILFGSVAAGYRLVMRCMVNGMHAFTGTGALISPLERNVGLGNFLPGFVAFWTRLWQLLDDASDGTAGFDAHHNNDTGITVTRPTDPRSLGYPDALGRPDRVSWDPLGSSDFTESRTGQTFGKVIPPNASASFLAQPRNTPNLCAFYGIGPAVSPGNPRSPVVSFLVDGVFGGEAMLTTGQVGGGATAELHDNDTGALVNSVTADRDGAGRLFAKYGVPRPFGNVSGLAQYTLSGGVPVYTTALGKLLNSYWLKASGLSGVTLDGSGYVLRGTGPNRLDVVIFDRFPMLLSFGAFDTNVDLATTTLGLHRAYRTGGRVNVDTGDLGGQNWTGAVAAFDAAGSALPALAVDRYDRIYLWYDGADGNAHGLMSEDYARTFPAAKARVVLAGIQYPRALFSLANQILAGHDGTNLKVYRSEDYFGTMPALAATLSGVPLQPVTLRADRHGRMYLIYTDGGGAVVQRTSTDGATWTAAATLIAAHDRPVSGFTIPFAMHVAWSGSVLQAYQSDSAYGSIAAGPAAVDDAIQRQYLGAAADRRDRVWVVAREGTRFVRVYSLGGLVFREVVP